MIFYPSARELAITRLASFNPQLHLSYRSDWYPQTTYQSGVPGLYSTDLVRKISSDYVGE